MLGLKLNHDCKKGALVDTFAGPRALHMWVFKDHPSGLQVKFHKNPIGVFVAPAE